jgi:flavin reductase (DIM6/NTAB) family NADH-FMN oxidoreductase RutF
MAAEKEILSALKRLEYGVHIVTMGKGNDGNAFTASWLTQVSSEPPMIVLAVHNKHQSSRMLEEHGAFVVNFLGQDDIATAKTYYGPAESGYQKLKNSTVAASAITGTAMLHGAAGYLDCRIVKKIPAGNHTLLLAEVVGAGSANDSPILTTSSAKLHYTG